MKHLPKIIYFQILEITNVSYNFLIIYKYFWICSIYTLKGRNILQETWKDSPLIWVVTISACPATSITLGIGFEYVNNGIPKSCQANMTILACLYMLCWSWPEYPNMTFCRLTDTTLVIYTLRVPESRGRKEGGLCMTVSMEVVVW